MAYELDPAAPAYAQIKAARGLELSCNGWAQEAALRMLMNSFDPEVAGHSRDLVVGGSGSVAHGVIRDRECFDSIVGSLRTLENDETLLVHSGAPVGVVRTHCDAPRLLLHGSHGPASAAAWMCIGAQEIVHRMYETFAVVGERHFTDDLAGKLIVSGGMGRMGGAQAVAATMTGAAFLGIEVDPERIKRRLRSGDCDFMVNSLDEALRILKNALRKKENISVGLVGNCADVLPELASRGVLPDILTDQTSAHDPLHGYVPGGMTLAQALELRDRDAQSYERRSLESMARHVEAMLCLQKMGAVTFECGNNIRAAALQQGVRNACDIADFVTEYLQPLCEGGSPFRWVALSGAARDIAVTDELLLELFPENRRLLRWIELARKRIRFRGLPARIAGLGHGEQAEFALAVNRMVKQGRIKAPMVMARDPLDGGSLASRGIGIEREIELTQAQQKQDASDLVAGSPRLSALLEAASGASWVSIPRLAGCAPLAVRVVVADGTEEMARRIQCVLTNDPEVRIPIEGS